MQEAVIQSSGSKSRTSTAGPYPGGSAVQREAAQQGHRAAPGINDAHCSLLSEPIHILLLLSDYEKMIK